LLAVEAPIEKSPGTPSILFLSRPDTSSHHPLDVIEPSCIIPVVLFYFKRKKPAPRVCDIHMMTPEGFVADGVLDGIR
jgi:hypothetical protein